MTDITKILQRIEQGDTNATDQLLPLVYEELRKLAAAKLGKEKPGQTLQPTALVHDAYLRLVGDGDRHWDSRRHFFAAAAEAMRRILVDRARFKARPKHGGGLQRMELNEDAATYSMEDSAQLLAVHEALDHLERESSTKAELVKLRYFAGMSLEEAATAMSISRATASRYWTVAKAWLSCKLEDLAD